MDKRIFFILSFALYFVVSILHAEEMQTKRIPEFKNDKVNVWESIIYPGDKQQLPLHRHDHDRLIVALTDGVLKITNEQGDSRFFELQQDKVYYFGSDKPGELHTDKNIGQRPIKMVVIEFIDKNSKSKPDNKTKANQHELQFDNLPSGVQ